MISQDLADHLFRERASLQQKGRTGLIRRAGGFEQSLLFSFQDETLFRQEVLDRYGPMPDPVTRLVEVAELRLAAEAAGVASISREEGWLVVRFGAGLTRATAMRLLAGPSLPGLRPGDVTFASNQVRLRLPASARKGWSLTQAVVARLSVVSG